MKQFKTMVLMTALTVLLVLIGGAVGGRSGMVIFLMIAVVMNLLGYWHSDKIAIRMTRAKKVSEQEAPELYNVVRALATSAHLPMPRIYITPSPQPNAFATGRNPSHAVVAVTEGLLNLLDQEELEGVLAHELAHIKNRDILISTIAAVMAGAITMIGMMLRWGLFFGSDDDESPLGLVGVIAMAILAPIAALLIQMAISRSREYQADASGASITHKPEGLAQALLKLEQGAKRVPMPVNPAAAHLFIINPFAGQNLVNLFSTHPPIQERVKKLREMSPALIRQIASTP